MRSAFKWSAMLRSVHPSTVRMRTALDVLHLVERLSGPRFRGDFRPMLTIGVGPDLGFRSGCARFDPATLQRRQGCLGSPTDTSCSDSGSEPPMMAKIPGNAGSKGNSRGNRARVGDGI